MRGRTALPRRQGSGILAGRTGGLPGALRGPQRGRQPFRHAPLGRLRGAFASLPQPAPGGRIARAAAGRAPRADGASRRARGVGRSRHLGVGGTVGRSTGRDGTGRARVGRGWKGHLGGGAAGGGSITLDLHFPFVPPQSAEDVSRLASLDFDRALSESRETWREECARGCTIHTPVPHLDRLHRNHLAHVLVSDFPMADDPRLINTSVGTSTYGNFANESCMIVQELAQRGLHDEARAPAGPLGEVPGHRRAAGELHRLPGDVLRRRRIRERQLQPASRLGALVPGRILPHHPGCGWLDGVAASMRPGVRLGVPTAPDHDGTPTTPGAGSGGSSPPEASRT